MVNGTIKRAGSLLAMTAACTAAAVAQEQPPPVAEGETVEQLVVTGRLKSTALDVVEARMEQDVVTDFLGAAAISRVGDSTASLALRRVPGVTLVNDQFIYVRGLGERYSSVQLNGAQVPSP
ncbi:MAG TPA: TonB-dependent receptor plug domain-containing protein, partial [Gammaproteobacteria bacterium]|nr:TonB-dependent receptor plug domain-containing protein [Gammaproteobacteria bacterium]